MNEVIRRTADRYTGLSRERKVTVLLSLAFHLTVECRGLMELSDSAARKPANGFNQLQHKLLAQALKELAGEARYPDDVLFAIMDDIAGMNGISESQQAALVAAMETV